MRRPYKHFQRCGFLLLVIELADLQKIRRVPEEELLAEDENGEINGACIKHEIGLELIQIWRFKSRYGNGRFRDLELSNSNPTAAKAKRSSPAFEFSSALMLT